MNHLREVNGGVYLIGSPELTDPEDCCVYLLDLGDLVLIDAGAGGVFPRLWRISRPLGSGTGELPRFLRLTVTSTISGESRS